MEKSLFNSPKDYLVDGPLSKDFMDLKRDIQLAGNSVIAELSSPLAKWDHSVQDASYVDSLVIGSNESVLTEIRFSRYGRMAVITNEDMVSKDHLEIISHFLAKNHFHYISETEFGEPFRTRIRMNGDWFHQYFDYI